MPQLITSFLGGNRAGCIYLPIWQGSTKVCAKQSVHTVSFDLEASHLVLKPIFLERVGRPSKGGLGGLNRKHLLKMLRPSQSGHKNQL